MLSKITKLFGEMKPVDSTYSTPASAPSALASTKARILVMRESTPIDSAASSSSRTARIWRPEFAAIQLDRDRIDEHGHREQRQVHLRVE